LRLYPARGIRLPTLAMETPASRVTLMPCDAHSVNDGPERRGRAGTVHTRWHMSTQATGSTQRGTNTGESNRAQMDECIRRCLECVNFCNRCAAECMTNGAGQQQFIDCATACLDCAEVSSSCAALCSRDSALVGVIARACAEFCETCATMCEKGCEKKCSMDDHMRRCAEACRSCAVICRQMAA
jgi:hypothetical protein